MGWIPGGEAMRLARGLGAVTPWWEPVSYPWTTSVIFPSDFRDRPAPVPAVSGAHGWQSDAAWQTSGHTEPSWQAFTAHDPGVVLDPCCGEGYTSRSAVTAGWTFVGHEITARRALERHQPHRGYHGQPARAHLRGLIRLPPRYTGAMPGRRWRRSGGPGLGLRRPG